MFGKFIDGLNRLHSNVWAVLVLACSTILYLHGKDAPAYALATGAFAVIQSSKKFDGQSTSPDTAELPGK